MAATRLARPAGRCNGSPTSTLSRSLSGQLGFAAVPRSNELTGAA